jgi:outer membrane protein assembly factor BamD (BamD/ComL family)
MAVSGILSSSVFNLLTQLAGQSSSQTNPHNKFPQIKQDFQQLGSDLSSGNLSQAQSDFSALQQLLPGSQQNSTASSATTAASAQTTNPLLAAVNQLGQDLQSGNLSAAQADFATVQQDVQQAAPQQGAGGTHHHHHHHSFNSDSNSSQQSAISTLFSELGSSLQSGNLSAAQAAYSTLQQDFQQMGFGTSTTNSGSSTTAATASTVDSGLNISV